GGTSTDPLGRPLTYRWSLASRPARSTAVLDGADTAAATFTPDVDGTYRVALVVNDGLGDSDPANVAVTSYPRDTGLALAGHAGPRARLVATGAARPALHIPPPHPTPDVVVPPPAAPVAVAVAHDGLHAAVGHDHAVTSVDLAQGVVLHHFPTTATTNDIE